MYSYLDPLNLNNWGFFDNYVERKDAVNKLNRHWTRIIIDLFQ